MSYTLSDLAQISADLKRRQAKLDNPHTVLKSKELRALLAAIKDQPAAKRAEFGKRVNQLKRDLERAAKSKPKKVSVKSPIDVTAPFDVDIRPADQPTLLGADHGSLHPVSEELSNMTNIFSKMGFDIANSRLIDDDYHMFEALNFPKDHPARDDYDTFMTEENLILPAHTSTMQHRVLKSGKQALESGQTIAVAIPGRVFRNEDLDSTHEHTFHQVEGVYVDENVSLAHMLGTIQAFLEAYFKQGIEFKTQPFYFPFVEPGLEFLIKMPDSLKKTNQAEWLEIMGCGMIHPNVLSEAGIDPTKFSGFAWGMGVERLVMLKNGIEDIRHFMSGDLDFLKVFGASK